MIDPDDPYFGILKSLYADPLWRLTSGEVYKIAPADGTGIQPFIPSKEQRAIYESLLLEGVKQLMLPKCRRPGFSTALGIFVLDQMIFNEGYQASLVDQTASDASRKMERIVYVAYDNLPPFVKEDIRELKKNDSHLSISYKDGTVSDFWAGMDARGASNDFLWLSEWSVIQFEDPKRSSRIRMGALPSARHGKIVVESTWRGGKYGDVYELIEPVLNGVSDDWKIMFTGWWQDKRNVSSTAAIDDVARKYFTVNKPHFDALGVTITEEQMRWWSAEKRKMGIYMNSESPSFLWEMWLSPVQGAIYAEAIEVARVQGRITSMPISERFLVHTAWDLGAPRQTRVIYFQVIGEWIHIVDCDLGTDETIVQRVARMKAKGYNYGSHYLPHDAMQTERSGKTLATEMAAAWLKTAPEMIGNYNAVTGKMDPSADYKKCGLRFVPRTNDIWSGINYGLQMFPEVKFRAPQCEDMLSIMALYRTPTVKDGGVDRGEPIHDHSSHLCDAYRTLAEARMGGLIEVASPMQITDKWSKIFPDQFGRGSGLQVLRGPTSMLGRR